MSRGSKARKLPALSVVLIAAVAGCNGRAPRADLPMVIVSVPPQAFAVDKVAGGLVAVEVMVPPGASPATHEPTIAQLEALARAQLYVKVGHPDFPYERAWLDRLVAGRPDLAIVSSAAGIGVESEDPHVWVSPRYMRSMATDIHAALSRMLPAHRATLDANLSLFVSEIDSLDEELRRLLKPVRGHRCFVFHPAWGYLTADYGLTQVAIETHGKEPDARALSAIISQAGAAGVRALFVQPQFNPASAQLIAGEIGAHLESLDPLAYEWTDNLRRVGRLLAEYCVE